MQMKSSTLKTRAMLTLIIALALSHLFRCGAQRLASDVLADIMAHTNVTPLKLYPPGFIDWLGTNGDNPLAVTVASDRPVRPEPVGPLINDGSLSFGRFGMMSMSRPSPSDPAPDYDYVLVDLGTIGGNYSWAYGINNAGQIVGLSTTSGDNAYHAFRYQNGIMQDLGTLGGGSSYCYGGLGANGQVVGSSWLTYNGTYTWHAFSYVGGVMTDLGTLGLNGASSTSGASAVNASGTIVGGSDNHAFSYSGGTMTDLGTFLTGPNPSDAGQGINDYGDILCNASTNAMSRIFIVHDGTKTDIGTLGGRGGTGYSINMYGEVVGQANTAGDTSYHAFFYDGTIQDLGVLPGRSASAAYSLNSKAHVVGASADNFGNNRALLISNGSMKDLNDITINASGWTLTDAWGINDNEQIVGWGSDPSGHKHAFLLNPVTSAWRDNITADTSRQNFGEFSPSPGKDKLILVTHGRIPKGDDPDDSTAWVDYMANSISAYLSSHGINDWQVVGHKWKKDAQASIFDVLENAKQQGVSVGLQIVANGYTDVHLISHSAGAGLIQHATDVIRKHSPSVVIHETFLDPYVGWDFSGTDYYGTNADWAETYSTKDSETGNEILPFTYNVLKNAYNVDVTYLDYSDRIARPYWVSGNGTPCYTTESTHIWPVNFYSNSIVAAVTMDYQGFGFPLSEVGGQWSFAKNNYQVGNGVPGSGRDLKVLGTADPAGCRVQFPAPIYPKQQADFVNSATVASTTGNSQKFANSSIVLSSGSPAWIATFVTLTNPVNYVSFDAEFQSSAGAQGLVSVYWDEDTIGSIDERMVQDGLQHYVFRFPNTSGDSTHMLGFRLDPFTNIQSVVAITNVAMSFNGIIDPFTLAVTTNKSSSLLVYQLTGRPGFEYNIQASSNLVNWTTIATVANTNGTVQFIDPDSTNFSSRFYRAVAPY